MSHFTVLVIGDNPENQLAPYQENNMEDCPSEYLVFFDKTQELLNQWEDDKDEYPDFSVYVKEYHGFVADKDGRYGYWENPNAKWDWYQLGGRWAGFFALKPDPVLAVAGRPGLMTHSAEPGRADQCLAKDVDWDNTDTPTFAVLKDGVWYESGTMGWWGVVSNQKQPESWDAQFKCIISSLSGEEMLSLYDCHI